MDKAHIIEQLFGVSDKKDTTTALSPTLCFGKGTAASWDLPNYDMSYEYLLFQCQTILEGITNRFLYHEIFVVYRVKGNRT